MLTEITRYLLSSVFSLYMIAVLCRFLLQIARADFYNPLSQFIVKITDPLLKPLRRVIPGFGGVDVASLVLALLIQLAAMCLLILLGGFSLPPILSLVLWSIIGVLTQLLNIFFFALIIVIIVSWIAPGSYNPVLLLLRQITEPVLAPFRALIPPIGGLDLSPILVFFAINIGKIVLHHTAANLGMPTWMVFVM
ncbi:YggT family protein [bacterium]|nr:YggT family protein [bacterium]